MGLAASALAAAVLLASPAARAQESGRLLATSGVSQIDGAAGGGLVPWAVIAGYGTRDALGASVHDSYVRTGDFGLDSAGLAIGWDDRLELSYAHDWLFTGRAGARLGLGRGYQFQLDTAGAKLRLFGNLVYDQDTWLPEVSAGVQVKSADARAVLRAIGARASTGVDVYVAATKLLLAQSLLLNLTLRGTRANQFGLLGFGGDGGGYRAEPEASAALLLSRSLAVGAEWRGKPDDLHFAAERAAFDVFGAWFVTKHTAVTLAFVSLGPVARQGVQNGAYLSLQLGF